MKKTKPHERADVAVIYARYSSHNQKDASIEQQVEQCLAYARDKQLRITAQYADRAVSGKTDRRAEFQRMMRDAEKGKFTYVIAWKSNRIGRNMLQAMINETRLQDLGVRVLYVEEDFDDTAAGRFALRSMMNVNQFYSENMAEDIKRGMRDNAAKCKIASGRLPLGYKKGEDGRYAIDSPKDEIVREIFSRVARREAFCDIAYDLNLRGLKTSRGGKWGKSSFQNLICNERYTGVYIYDDIRVEGGVPQIVSKELFCKVQEVLKTKSNAKGRHMPDGDYALTGKLYCGKCKSPMIGTSGQSRSGELHHYYSCQKRRVGKTCDKDNVRRDDIEMAVAKAIKDYALQDHIIEWIADSSIAHCEKQKEQSHIALLEDDLKSNKTAIKNIMFAIEQGIITETTKTRLMDLEREQSELVQKITAANADIISIKREDMIRGLEMFRDGDVNNSRFRAKLFDTFLVVAYLYDDEPENLKIIFTFSGNNNTITVPTNIDNTEAECSYKLSIRSP